MTDIALGFFGLIACAVLIETVVEPMDRHPQTVILWVLAGMALFPISLAAATGYIAGIAAWVLSDAVSQWLDLEL